MKLGIIKSIDRLGRLVIPKKYRELYGLFDRAEVILTKDGILVRKRSNRFFKKKPSERDAL